MLQYLVWVMIYIITIKFMTKNAGRNSPIWGATFVLLSFPIMILSEVFLLIVLPAFMLNNSISNIFIFNILVMIFSFLFTIIMAFLLSKILKKKDLSKRKKETSWNYKWTAIIIGIMGLIMLFAISIVTKKVDSWLLALVMVAVVGAWQMDKRTKLPKNFDINELKNKEFILFLRSFDSESIISKPTKTIGIFEFWKYKLSSKKFTLMEKLNKYPHTIDNFLRLIIPSRIFFISLGNPEDYLPTVGSLKTYADNEYWREEIIKYMNHSKKIIILEGFSDGLRWELNFIKENISPLKLIILRYPATFRKNKKYKKSVNYIDFAKELNTLGYAVPTSDIEAGSLITFDSNWNAKIEGQGTKFLSEYFKDLT